MAAVKVPIAVLEAEIDRMSPPEVLKQFEEVLAAKSEVTKPIAFNLCISMPFDKSDIVPDAKPFEKLMVLYMFNKRKTSLRKITFFHLSWYVIKE